MFKHVIEFESTRWIDRIELRIELNSIELSWLFSTQLNTVIQSELSWVTRTWWQIYVDDEITVYQRTKTERIALRDKRSIDQKWLFKIIFFQ